jgi:hypothetical protein
VPIDHWALASQAIVKGKDSHSIQQFSSKVVISLQPPAPVSHEQTVAAIMPMDDRTQEGKHEGDGVTG